MRSDRPDVVVLGAGIMGTALAYHLSSRPSIRVVLIDSEPTGAVGSATSRSAGILSYPGWDPWDLRIVRETAEEYREVSASTGRGRYRANGGVRVARSEEGRRWLDHAASVLRAERVSVERWDPARARELLPGGGPSGLTGALYAPDDAIFSPSELASAYARLARRNGAEVRLERAPVPVRWAGDAWQLGLSVGPLESPRLVLACGAWTKPILRRLGVPAPLAAFRTRACVVRPTPLLPEFATLHDVDLELYVRPDERGRALAGDGTERVEADPDRSDPRAGAPFLSSTIGELSELVPAADSFEVESSWAGVCVASPDRFPLVGAAPGAPGLFVATGFNGLGAMRAGALARRLADGVVNDRWAPLAPADPQRFPVDPPAFEPRPELPPWEGEVDRPAGDGSDPPAARASPSTELADPVVAYRVVRSTDEAERLRMPSLSEWFDPFLPYFARESVRDGGCFEVAVVEGEAVGLYLKNPAEGVDSLFTRIRSIALRYLSEPGRSGLYVERAWLPGAESIELYAADLREWTPRARIRNHVRIAGPDDRSAVHELLRELAGFPDAARIAPFDRPEESAFVCEVDGRVVGLSGLTRVGPHARGHSFMVHPRYRGLGIGTDLLEARMRWLKRTGATDVVSEIYEGNDASRIAAERAGMSFVGRMYHYPMAR